VTTAGGGTNWKQVSGGSSFTAAIKTDGTLWTWGGNGSGQLGNDDQFLVYKTSPVTTAGGGTNWKQVAGGFSHTAATQYN
jgi:alpha-tubulin suppressor-like RCC1 family protein